MTAELVNVDNFVRAETHRMMADLQRDAGGVNRLEHNRAPASVEKQTVIRMNRDTLYSFAVVDISDGATLTVPEHGDRYVSVMIVNQDHYINEIFHDPGVYQLSVDRHDTPYVLAAARVLVDPNDPSDLDIVAVIQDGFGLTAESAQPFVLPDYDQASFDETRNALLALSRGLDGYAGAFGTRDRVDPVRHLIASAAAWGGLPESEAFYTNVDPRLPVGEYAIRVGDVPADAFWSVSLYNAAGYFEQVDGGLVSVNSVTAERNDDGTATISFGGPDDGRPNRLGLMEGWNYLVRFYRPRPEVVDGTWTFPEVEPVG